MFESSFEAIIEMANSASRRRRREEMEALQKQTSSIEPKQPLPEVV